MSYRIKMIKEAISNAMSQLVPMLANQGKDELIKTKVVSILNWEALCNAQEAPEGIEVRSDNDMRRATRITLYLLSIFVSCSIVPSFQCQHAKTTKSLRSAAQPATKRGVYKGARDAQRNVPSPANPN
eukprot:4886302-Amphidinium_carterae.1